MAKKLNKKVVLIGSAVLLLLVVVALAAIFHARRDAEKFISAGDAAWQVKDYDKATRSYLRAYKLAGSSPLGVEVLFKLADLYIETDQWLKARGCWQQIIVMNPKNVKARLAGLRYLYIIGDGYARTARSVSQVWNEIESQASEAIKVVEDAGLLAEESAKWEPAFGQKQTRAGHVPSRTLGSYLYLVRGRSRYELAQMGAVTSPEQLLDKATSDLQMVLQLEPNNVDAYLYLAEATAEKGRILASRGNVDEKEKAAKRADELLQQAVEAAGDDPRAHINLLSGKLDRVLRSETELVKQQIAALEPPFTALVARFPSSAEAFAALSRFYSAVARASSPWMWHGLPARDSTARMAVPQDGRATLSLKNLDKALDAMTKAIELDKENVGYAISAANLYYRKFSVHGQKSEMFKAIELAKNARLLADAQDTVGPRSYVNRINRFLLNSFLANCYIEQTLQPDQKAPQSQVDAWLAEAKKAVDEIQQIVGSGDDPQVVKWQGMLALASGEINPAVRRLYEAYQRTKASTVPASGDAHFAYLCYTLAKIFMDTSEVGAVMEFLNPKDGALAAGIEMTKPEAILDYLETLGKLGAWLPVISPDYYYNVSSFEERFGSNTRSRSLRIKALINTDRVAEAEEELARFPSDDPNTIGLHLTLVEAKIGQLRSAMAQRQMREDTGSIFQPGQAEEKQDLEAEAAANLMRAELDKHKQHRADLVDRLLTVSPDSVDEPTVTKVCSDLISLGQTGTEPRPSPKGGASPSEGLGAAAAKLVNRFVTHCPNSGVALFYKKLLSEPQPAGVSDQRRNQIEKEALSGIADPAQRALQLGIFYRRNNEPDRAIAQLRKVLETQASPPPASSQRRFKLSDQHSPKQIAASYLFDIATDNKNWQLAEQVAEIARREDLDDCQGQFFAARLAMAKSNFQDALAKTNECLKQKPIFSRAYLLRSNINAALGNENASVEDVRKAASWNSLDGVIAKGLANALYRRNLKLGGSASPEQVTETRYALENALRLNPGDLPLLSAYAEYISDAEPLKALAIRQTLHKNVPSLQNALLLARLATRMALSENDDARRQALFAIAGSSLDQARRSEPRDRSVLETYADYYRAQGQNEKAEQLLLEVKDQPLLWRHYFNLGRFEDAGKILQQLYAGQPKDGDVIRGLFLVADRTADQEAIKKYSEELLSLEDNPQNRLDQIKSYLKVGLVKEAEHKLQSFKEKYPQQTEVLLLEGWLAMRQGQLKRALELTNKSLEGQQDNAAAWRLRGEINLLMANYDQAIIDLRRSTSLSPTSEARIALAKAYLQAERADDAITELRNTIDVPGTPMEARSLLEQTYLRLGRKEALKKFYDETLQKFPQSAFWYNRAGGFAAAVGEFDRAEQMYQKAYLMKRQLYPTENLEAGWRDVQYAMALDGYLQALVLAAGDPTAKQAAWRPDKLNKLFEESAKYVDTPFAPIAYYRTAEARSKLGDKDAAVQYCRKAVDQAGTNERLASEILLRMFLLVGEQEVSKYCQQKLQTAPNSLAANFTMFNLAKIRGEYDQAADYIDKCIQITGSDTARGVDYIAKKTEVLAVAYQKTSDNKYLAKAIRDYESLLAKLPNNTTVLNNLAYMLAENNERLQEALEYAKRALEQRPNNPVFLDTYAYVLYRSDMDSKADESMTAALLQYEQSELAAPPEVYEHKGMIKEKLGQKKQALDAYKRALEIGADKLPDPVKQRLTSAIERVSR